MKNKTKLMMVLLLIGTTSMAALYTQDFDSGVSTLQPDMPKNFGGTNANAFTSFGTYVLAGPNAAIVDQGGGDFALRPNLDTKNNARVALTMIDVSSWGAGTYTLQFDFIGADGGGSRLYVGEAYGYDLTGSTAAAIKVDGFAGGFGLGADGNGFGLFGVSGATASHLVDINLDGVGGANETVSRTITQDFTISANATAIGIGFGSYNSSFMIDNVSVIPEPATLGLVALSGTSVLLLRRRLML
jgi:hypothetical protein